MKGKKFDAHQKHFKEKEIKLNREMNYLRDRCTEVNNQNMKLAKENEQVNKKYLDIKEKYDKLIKYSNLSDEDISEALQSDKSLNELSTLFKLFPTFL